MSDYRIEVTVKNARLWNAIKRAGFESVAALCRAMGKPDSSGAQSEVGKLLQMKQSPLTSLGEWRPLVIKIAEITRTLPSQLFTDEQMIGLPENRVAFEVDSAHMVAMLEAQSPSRSLALQDLRGAVDRQLATLSEGEQYVLRKRFGLDGPEQTYDAIALERKITRERVRQIEAKAMRKMRHPSRRQALDVMDDVAVDTSVPYDQFAGRCGRCKNWNATSVFDWSTQGLCQFRDEITKSGHSCEWFEQGPLGPSRERIMYQQSRPADPPRQAPEAAYGRLFLQPFSCVACRRQWLYAPGYDGASMTCVCGVQIAMANNFYIWPAAATSQSPYDDEQPPASSGNSKSN